MFYARRTNLGLYALVVVSFATGILFRTNVTIPVALSAFLAWDICFAASGGGFAGRSVDAMLTAVGAARQQIAYFLPFYGLFFGALMTLDEAKIARFRAILNAAGVGVGPFVLPFITSLTAMLFVPTRVQDASGSPSSAVKSLFIVSAWCQKATIFVFGHVFLRISMELFWPVTP